jgi:hypothetical protein
MTDGGCEMTAPDTTSDKALRERIDADLRQF